MPLPLTKLLVINLLLLASLLSRSYPEIPRTGYHRFNTSFGLIPASAK
jgi:hypothetical protein